MAHYRGREAYPSGAQTSRLPKADNIFTLPRISKSNLSSTDEFGIEGRQFQTPLPLAPGSPFAAVELPISPSLCPSSVLVQLHEPISHCICGQYLCFISLRDKEIKSLLLNFHTHVAFQCVADVTAKVPKISSADLAEQISQSFKLNHESDLISVTSKRIKGEECLSLNVKLFQTTLSFSHTRVDLTFANAVHLMHSCFLRLEVLNNQLLSEKVNSQLTTAGTVGKAMKAIPLERVTKQSQTENFTLKIHEQCVSELERMSKQISDQVSELRTMRLESSEPVSIPSVQVEGVLDDAYRSLSGVIHLAYRDQSADPKPHMMTAGLKIELDHVLEVLGNLKNRLGISDNEKINYIVSTITNNTLYKPDMNALESDITLKRFLQALLDPIGFSRIARVTDKTSDFINRLQKSKAATKKKLEEKEIEKEKQREPLKDECGEEHAPNTSEAWSGGSVVVGSSSVPDSLLSKLLVPELLPKFGADLKKGLLEMDLWSFNSENIHSLTAQSLFQVTYTLFHFYNLIKTFKIPENTLAAFLKKIESLYPNNSFHNAVKTADATHAVHFLISNYAYKHLTSIDILSILLASCIRDVGHNGVTNLFEVHTNSEKATLYNDHSPLENHHLTASFQILSKKEYNILSGLNQQQYTYVRRMVIKLVLCTDMSKHLKVHGKFKYLLNPKTFRSDLYEHRAALLQLFMKVSDVACFCRAPPWYVKWFDRRWDEYQSLGDQERALGIPISPFCERDQPPENRIKSVMVFFNYVIYPQIKVLHEFDKSSLPLLQQLNTNKFDWEAMYNSDNIPTYLAEWKVSLNSKTRTTDLQTLMDMK